MTTWFESWLEWLWPQTDEEQYPSPIESDLPTKEVLTNKKLLNNIFYHLNISDLKSYRLVNSTWKELATAEIQFLRNKNAYLITDLQKLEQFVTFWNDNGKNLPWQNFSISLQPDYPQPTLDSLCKAIAPVVKKLQISYNGALELKSHTTLNLAPPIRGFTISSDIQSQVSFEQLEDLHITLYNVTESYSHANWTNVAIVVLNNSPNLITLSLNAYGDEIIVQISDFLVHALNTRGNKNLKNLYITGADMTDHHFLAMSTIQSLKLKFVSLAIPTFIESQLQGNGLIRFLESQASTLTTLQIDELTDVFDDFKFPRLENLTSLEIGKYQQTRSWTGRPVRIDYKQKLPELRNISFRRMGAEHWIHFLPCRLSSHYPVTWVQSVVIDDDFMLESDVVKIVAAFRNLKTLQIPAFDRAVNEVYRTQENLTELVLYHADTAFLDEMLTGLNVKEEKILECKPFVGITDRLVLDLEFDFTKIWERKSLGCLQELTKLRLIKEFQTFAEREVVVPSLVTFKLLLVNMETLQFVDIGDGYKIWMKNLPKHRQLEETDFPAIVQREWFEMQL